MITNTNEDYGLENRNHHSKHQPITSETMENKDPAINQHEIDSDRSEEYDTQYKEDDEWENDGSDDNFDQKDKSDL